MKAKIIDINTKQEIVVNEISIIQKKESYTLEDVTDFIESYFNMYTAFIQQNEKSVISSTPNYYPFHQFINEQIFK